MLFRIIRFSKFTLNVPEGEAPHLFERMVDRRQRRREKRRPGHIVKTDDRQFVWYPDAHLICRQQHALCDGGVAANQAARQFFIFFQKFHRRHTAVLAASAFTRKFRNPLADAIQPAFRRICNFLREEQFAEDLHAFAMVALRGGSLFADEADALVICFHNARHNQLYGAAIVDIDRRHRNRGTRCPWRLASICQWISSWDTPCGCKGFFSVKTVRRTPHS